MAQSEQTGALQSGPRAADGGWNLSSPEGKVKIRVLLEAGRLFFAVSDAAGEIVGKSPLGIRTSAADFTQCLVYIEESRDSVRETYRLSAGKRAVCQNSAEQLTLRFSAGEKIIEVVFRAYDDGAAFRYRLGGEGPVSVFGEETAFALPKSSEGWAADFIKSYEGFYLHRTAGELVRGNFLMPLLVRAGGRYLLLSEAAVYGEYCASHIEGDAEKNLLRFRFAPDEGPSVTGTRPLQTPWRVMVIGSLADLVETGLFENLNPPREIADVSWIRPGRAAWSWWSGDSTSDLAVQKEYVDFAQQMGWEYYLCDAGWQSGWIDELARYAGQRGIGIFVWFHYRSVETDERRDAVFSRLAAAGVKGVKVDFFESDSQERLRLYDNIAETAAKYRLMVVYHGCTKPSGERRRWPHILTREGILGAEYYKFDGGPNAAHNCTVPFTRNVAGPMDYTPVTFSTPKLNTTWAHQLALPVVFESPLTHYADRPVSYRGLGAALNFLKECPSSWDDTKLLEGLPGEYVTVARKKGGSWFVGALCGDENEHTASIRVSELIGKACRAEIYTDADAEAPGIDVQTRRLSGGETLRVPLRKAGGCAVRLTPEPER